MVNSRSLVLTMQYYMISVVRFFALIIFLNATVSCASQSEPDAPILPGAYQISEYLPRLEGKQVGLFVNHTSLIGNTHLTDTLLSLGVNIKKVFSPEHGFKGNKPDGAIIENESSSKFELIALYGKSKKATQEHISGLDILVIDIQDVGIRCYTYSSTMSYLMDACAIAGIPVMILDRPNPNGSYADGPMLELAFKSFVGLHPIPLIHGLTLGELAGMINEEGWLESGRKCKLSVIPVANWDHSMPYSLPVPPSPNLPNDLAISLYPSLVLFEGTVVSVGRGTDFPFQIIGHPKYGFGSFGLEPNLHNFKPTANAGSTHPPLEDQECFGVSFAGTDPNYKLDLTYLLEFYKSISANPEVEFFNDYFEKLAGTDQLRQQIIEGKSEAEIKASWQPDLEQYALLRARYLIYN
ncbi:MAG: hypothetical protein ACI83W_002391 [Marinoscillum sp.]|jgi:uncharacterized protein YbbC (DUF1343 family)